ncbi:YhcB family protein [Volucribacter amazonae]|uniref:Z-ring associated protein G n=1 Tax=Volucribacter amazonae TaxID=256731 RepID=A0A9X4SL32_9PAST|nr:DUF1043 family protein [Volucribacter amazonae]MDG6894643.1 hypothetical protein [Volucribacter amazonae]
MQSWTSEMWQTALIGLVIGVILGYLILRFTKGSVKKQVQTETELKQLKNQVATQQQELEKHFAESAELLKNFAQDYQKLYQHFAKTSATLMPETENKALFTPNLLPENAQDEKTELEVITPETSLANHKDNPPKDYSEGSSGILKAEK